MISKFLSDPLLSFDDLSAGVGGNVDAFGYGAGIVADLSIRVVSASMVGWRRAMSRT
jgi:hypothetical protein